MNISPNRQALESLLTAPDGTRRLWHEVLADIRHAIASDAIRAAERGEPDLAAELTAVEESVSGAMHRAARRGI